MAKNKTKGAAAKPKVAALTAEEFQKLSPEEQVAHLAKVQDENASLSSALAASKKNGKQELPSFPVDDDEANDIEGGEYQFTCQKFTWTGGKVIDVIKLMEEAEGEDKKKAEAAMAIIAKLLQKKSGILRRKED